MQKVQEGPPTSSLLSTRSASLLVNRLIFFLSLQPAASTSSFALLLSH